MDDFPAWAVSGLWGMVLMAIVYEFAPVASHWWRKRRRRVSIVSTNVREIVVLPADEYIGMKDKDPRTLYVTTVEDD